MDECGVAFKEWGAICAALQAGRQTLIARKGGIHEGRAGFRVAHPRFWLFPTFFHEQTAALAPDGAPFLAAAEALRPPAGQIALQLLAEVTDVVELTAEAQLAALAGLQIWSPETLHSRFLYRQPGLFVLIVRVFVREEPHLVDDDPLYAGCRSWVDLSSKLRADAVRPVLTEHEFARTRITVLERLGS